MLSSSVNVAWTRLLVCLASVVYVQGQRLPSSFFGVPGTDAAYDYVIVGGVSIFEYFYPFIQLASLGLEFGAGSFSPNLPWDMRIFRQYEAVTMTDRIPRVPLGLRSLLVWLRAMPVLQ